MGPDLANLGKGCCGSLLNMESIFEGVCCLVAKLSLAKPCPRVSVKSCPKKTAAALPCDRMSGAALCLWPYWNYHSCPGKGSIFPEPSSSWVCWALACFRRQLRCSGMEQVRVYLSLYKQQFFPSCSLDGLSGCVGAVAEGCRNPAMPLGIAPTFSSSQGTFLQCNMYNAGRGRPARHRVP